MDKKRKLHMLLSWLLIILLISGTGCARSASADGEDLMKDIGPQPVSLSDTYVEEDILAAMNFSLDIFKANISGTNTLVSPVSVLSALGMTANGAEEATLAQMEEVFGISKENLNSLINLYMRNLPEEEKLKVSMANSIWFREGGRIEVNQEFLQTNATYYNAGIFRAAFDEATLKSINEWVEEETDGMIEDVLDEIPEEAMMYLINALSFDAEWEKIYEEHQIRNEPFYADDGTMEPVEMMFSEESQYIEDDQAKGFIKNYADGDYAFVALLPDEDIHLSEYIAGLDGDKLLSLIRDAETAHVKAMMPKFDTEFSVEMSDILISLGMVDAFDEKKADLTGLGRSPEGNLYISRVIHKTKISLDEKGTKAGAATVVEVVAESAVSDVKEVVLDRPFVYLIIDKNSNLPLFMGTALKID